MKADGKDSGLQGFTSLMGLDKCLLLQVLPSKLSDIFPEDRSATTLAGIYCIFDNV